jgi:hypothetical protein
MKRILLSMVAVIAVLGLFFGSCSSPSPTATPTTYPQFTPTFYYVNIYITEGDDSSSGANVNAFVRIAQNIDISMVSIIYYYDVTPPVTPGQPAFSAPGTYVVRVPLEESTIWKNVPPGQHTFSAQLVNPDDNSPLDPPVIARSIVTVPASNSKTPEIRIMSVQSSLPIYESFLARTQAPLPPIEVQVDFSAHNIRMSDDNIGKQNVPGEGHVIYYRDVTPPTAPGVSALTAAGTCVATTDDFHIWEEVDSGDHTFWVQLVNNDNTPLEPAVIARTDITVPALY